MQIKIIYLRIPLLMNGRRNGKLDLKRLNNSAGDFVLQRKDALHFAFVRFRPNMETVSRINQLRGNTNAITLPLQSSFQHILNV